MRTRSLAALLGLGLSLVATAGCDHNDDDGVAPAPSASFQFASMPASAYQRVDRMGMPVVATAVITSKDAYNGANPANDGSEPFLGEIATNVAAYHSALDGQLMGLGLDPATNSESLAQAGPLIIPDVLKIDPAQPSGFPNGRRLQDQTPDITLAVVLLDLGTTGQSATTFASLPLNPPANDVALSGSFPYLAAPHAP